MSRNIDAIFLDTGNTMRITAKDPAFQYSIRRKLVELAGAKESPDDFFRRLDDRYESYKKWARETLVQVTEADLWTRWMLPEFPAEKIAPHAGRLTRLWIDHGGHRIPRPDAKQTLIELHKRGYVLGIIANTASTTEIPEWLEADGLKPYFKAVILSSQLGIRKPNPEVYLEAARRAGVEPGRSAYIGDNPSRDIQGARSAGFKMVVILLEAATLKKEPPKVKERPDHIIHECRDLLTIFPPR